MNAVRKFTVLCLLLLIVLFTNASNYSNDVFVLVDVSGTMKDANANMEAKIIVQEILLGEFDYSKWQTRGWNKNNTEDVIPSEKILKQGSRFCLIPFGNMNRVHNYTRHVFQNKDIFNSFYASHFPESFNDGWTYLTLAKAYVGSIAITDKIKNAYVFIYTDGRPESTKEPYDNFNQQIVDDLEYAGSNSFKKIGILRKNANSRFHYDIEVWEFASYKTLGVEGGEEVKDEDEPVPDPSNSQSQFPKASIKIVSPNDGKIKANPHEVEKDQEWTLRWTGGAGNVNVYKKEGNNYKLIPHSKRNEIYTQSISGTTAKLTFFESTDYKIEVRGTNGGSDTMFLSVTTPILPILLKLLLIIGLIVAGVYAYNQFFRPGPKTTVEDNGWEGMNRKNKNTSHASTGNDDW